MMTKIVCPNCQETTKILITDYSEHLWFSWGECEHCRHKLIQYKDIKDIGKPIKDIKGKYYARLKLLLPDKYIKVGQKFMGLINNEVFKIIKILHKGDKEQYHLPVRYDYVRIQTADGKTSETSLQNFKRLLITPVE